MTKYVVIRDMAAGNDSVGEMWQETKIFDGSATLDEVMLWALSENYGNLPKDKIDDIFKKSHSRKRITITKPHE